MSCAPAACNTRRNSATSHWKPIKLLCLLSHLKASCSNKISYKEGARVSYQGATCQLKCNQALATEDSSEPHLCKAHTDVHTISITCCLRKDNIHRPKQHLARLAMLLQRWQQLCTRPSVVGRLLVLRNISVHLVTRTVRQQPQAAVRYYPPELHRLQVSSKVAAKASAPCLNVAAAFNSCVAASYTAFIKPLMAARNLLTT